MNKYKIHLKILSYILLTFGIMLNINLHSAQAGPVQDMIEIIEKVKEQYPQESVYDGHCESNMIGQHGVAGWLYQALFGADSYKDSTLKYVSGADFWKNNEVCVGDIFALGPHEESRFIVIDVADGIVHYMDEGVSYDCGYSLYLDDVYTVHWDHTMTLEKFHSACVYIYHKNGNNVRTLTDADASDGKEDGFYIVGSCLRW